jgi:hypothetical protein
VKSKETGRKQGYDPKRLRNRFVSRAKFLAKDPAFGDDLRCARTFWNETHPQYHISLNDQERREPPRTLLQDWGPLTYNSMKELLASKMPVHTETCSEAMDTWVAMTTAIALEYWPQENFPHPSVPEQHPAIPFITESLYLPHAYARVKDIDACFREFDWQPEPMTMPRGHALWQDVTPYEIEDAGWCLPLYPDITAKDLEDAAPYIAAEIERVYRRRTLDARVAALKGEDMTHKQIANLLGISTQAVSKILKSVERNPNDPLIT